MTQELIPNSEEFKKSLESFKTTKSKRVFEKFALAALGSIPWVGGFLSAAASIKSDEEDHKKNELQTQWLEEHSDKMRLLATSLDHIHARLEQLGPEIHERMESQEYLNLVRKSFRAWDQADTDDKRNYIANLIANSAGTKLCSDDVIRLFIDWLNLYHEAHFQIIRNIYQNPGTTRYDIWTDIHGEIVREDSAEADLYRMLIRDLSTGGVIRQARDTNEDGQFMKKRARPVRKGYGEKTMESAFEDSKQYVLTALGKQFVHYTMNEVVSRVE